MKAIPPLLIAAIVFFACNSSTDTATPEMPGVYSMQSQTIDDGTNQTTLKELKQLKVYTDDYFMYVQSNNANSTYSFGIGSYSVDDSGYVIEKTIFTARDTNFNAEPKTYKLDITTNYDGYKQVIPDITIGGQKSKLTELYTRSGSKESTPLDGVWKLTNFFIVNGNDTASFERTQYKAFYNGYFMYGQYIINDSTGGHSTGMGYGTFKMDGDTKLQETDLNSSYNITPGQVYTLDVQMVNENGYKQTLNQPDGSKHIEVYQRMKSK